MQILIWSIVLAASLAVLLKAAEVFVSKAALAALNLGVSDMLIGVTLVALGTSLPELAASLASVFKGAGEFVTGTVVGSNVANIGLILGVTALLFGRLGFSGRILRRDVPVMAGAAAVLSVMALNGTVTRTEGAALFALYPLYLIFAARGTGQRFERSGRLRKRTITWLVLSGAAIYAGAEFTVRSVIALTGLLGFADTSFLALTVVAVGSSLPELAVSLSAARRGFFDICLGNVVGSNICNSLLVAGAPALISPLPASRAVIAAGLPFMLASTLLLPLLARGGGFGRVTGALLLLVFISFLAFLAVSGVRAGP